MAGKKVREKVPLKPLDDLLRSNVPDSSDIAEISLDLLHDFKSCCNDCGFGVEFHGEKDALHLRGRRIYVVNQEEWRSFLSCAFL